MSLVYCMTPEHISEPHGENSECVQAMYVAPEGPTPSMTATETLDPREAL